MEGPLEHPRSPNFLESTGTPNFTYDTLSGLDYLQYPTSEPYSLSSLNLTNPLADYSFTSSYTTTGSSPARSYTPPSHGIYPAMLTGLNPGETSSDGMRSGRASRGSGGSPSLSSVPRSHRYNPIAVSTPPARTMTRKRRGSKSDDFSDDDDDFQPAPSTGGAGNEVNRREEIRRQRIESEQRRRDELRDGYRRLKEALPISNQKSSKVSLLDRATTHIKYLEMTQGQLQTRLQQAENETARLRSVNEALMLGTAEQRHAAAAAAVAAVQQQSANPTF